MKFLEIFQQKKGSNIIKGKKGIRTQNGTGVHYSNIDTRNKTGEMFETHRRERSINRILYSSKLSIKKRGRKSVFKYALKKILRICQSSKKILTL